MHSIRFIMVGGFLGAGKTTTLARLARFYMGRGQKIGLVTNDQAQDLVDTHALREQGFPVQEVAGACFCCKFDELLEKVDVLRQAERPDVVLAEPVGSCTDLVATVVQPLKDLYGARFTVAPYTVLFKPSHGLKILRDEAGAGFSPKASYIFRKQLEEADAILINRVDELAAAEADELARLVTARYPGAPVLRVSAKTGHGFDAVSQLLDQEGTFGRKILDIDYDIYAEGEAELGWLNSSVRVSAGAPFALDDLLLDVVGRLQQSLANAAAEIAHLKAIGLWEGFFGVANLVNTGGKPELSLPSRCQAKEVDLIVNARVAMDPAELRQHVEKALHAAGQARGAALGDAKTQSFRPGRPQPTHRYAEARS
ncbi:MAG: CobW-like GTP-binding protein [Gemmataceae bacterium]|nr:CobW-like GTP-binding protein [Gemmataceae bacterium]